MSRKVTERPKSIKLLEIPPLRKAGALAAQLGAEISDAEREARTTYNKLARLYNGLQARFDEAYERNDQAKVDALDPLIQEIADWIDQVLAKVGAYIDGHAGDTTQIDAINKRLSDASKAVVTDTADYTTVSGALDDLKKLVGLAVPAKN